MHLNKKRSRGPTSLLQLDVVSLKPAPPRVGASAGSQRIPLPMQFFDLRCLRFSLKFQPARSSLLIAGEPAQRERERRERDEIPVDDKPGAESGRRVTAMA